VTIVPSPEAVRLARRLRELRETRGLTQKTPADVLTTDEIRQVSGVT
jgi:hypothetical protein